MKYKIEFCIDGNENGLSGNINGINDKIVYSVDEKLPISTAFDVVTLSDYFTVTEIKTGKQWSNFDENCFSGFAPRWDFTKEVPNEQG